MVESSTKAFAAQTTTLPEQGNPENARAWALAALGILTLSNLAGLLEGLYAELQSVHVVVATLTILWLLLPVGLFWGVWRRNAFVTWVSMAAFAVWAAFGFTLLCAFAVMLVAEATLDTGFGFMDSFEPYVLGFIIGGSLVARTTVRKLRSARVVERWA